MNRVLNCVLSGIALGIFICLMSSQPVAAQCPSGWGQSQYRIASNDWTSAVQPVDVSAISGPNGTFQLGSGSEIASMGDGGAFLLNSGDHTIYHLTLATAGPAKGLPGWTGSFNISDLPPTPQNPVQGTLRNIQVLGGMLYAWTDAGSLMALASNPNNPVQFLFTAGAFNFGGSIAGITFDGQYLWGASGGYLWQLNPGSVSRASTTLPSLVNKYPMTGVTVGALAFDGNYIWILANGSGLIKIDPSTGQQVASASARYFTETSLLFDGYDLWFGNGGNGVSRMDPATMTLTTLTAPGVSVYTVMGLDRDAVWAESASGIARFRACDSQFIGNLALSSIPWQTVYDGVEHWITYKDTNLLSIR
ncbi:MAG: hypothetical protein ABSH56_18430 [Bryobacteraceae bacterium]|jgi:hypothetical protein